VKSVDAIVTGSAASKTDLVELLGVDPDRVSVIPYGISESFAPLPSEDPRLHEIRKRYALTGDYLLTVGAIEPRKNLVRLLHAVRVLRSANARLRELQLVHVGPMGWHALEVPRAVSELGLADHVRFLGYVPDDDLSVLYQLARASVYPSLFEGFGFPVLEAMASGCPVVTGNCSSLPEVAGDAAVLVDPTSVESIAEGVRRAWEDDELRRQLRDRGLKRAAQFTWNATARETMRLYDRLLGAA
jgi:glycosyltransferase involved in cell wall biosynthesis